MLNHDQYTEWARDHKTIIICAAVNSAGVLEAANKLAYFAERLGLATAAFNEDVASLNGAPTACGIIVPSMYYDAKPCKAPAPTFLERLFGYKPKPKYAYVYEYPNNPDITGYFKHDETGAEFIKFLKSYRLA